MASSYIKLRCDEIFVISNLISPPNTGSINIKYYANGWSLTAQTVDIRSHLAERRNWTPGLTAILSSPTLPSPGLHYASEAMQVREVALRVMLSWQLGLP